MSLFLKLENDEILLLNYLINYDYDALNWSMSKYFLTSHVINKLLLKTLLYFNSCMALIKSGSYAQGA